MKYYMYFNFGCKTRRKEGALPLEWAYIMPDTGLWLVWVNILSLFCCVELCSLWGLRRLGPSAQCWESLRSQKREERERDSNVFHVYTRHAVDSWQSSHQVRLVLGRGELSSSQSSLIIISFLKWQLFSFCPRSTGQGALMMGVTTSGKKLNN